MRVRHGAPFCLRIPRAEKRRRERRQCGCESRRRYHRRLVKQYHGWPTTSSRACDTFISYHLPLYAISEQTVSEAVGLGAMPSEGTNFHALVAQRRGHRLKPGPVSVQTRPGAPSQRRPRASRTAQTRVHAVATTAAATIFRIVKRTSVPSLCAKESVPHPWDGVQALCDPPPPIQIKVVYRSLKAREAGQYRHWHPFSGSVAQSRAGGFILRVSPGRGHDLGASPSGTIKRITGWSFSPADGIARLHCRRGGAPRNRRL